jgi:RNA polymerase sigma-70 factor (ECF subfamily)
MEPGSQWEEAALPREIDDLTLRRAQRGEERASRDLVAHYQRPVFALLGRLLCGAERRGLLEDLARETFLRVLREVPRFSIVGAARLSSWILTLAARLALEELQRQRLAPARLRDAADFSAAAATAAAPGRPEPGGAIRRAAAALPPETRAVYLLRDYHDLEFLEIARALEIDLDTVHARLGRARVALCAALAEVDGADDGGTDE